MPVGIIKFHGGHIEQHWNPSQIEREQRENIARELEAIAKGIRADLFEDKGEMKRFPIRKVKKIKQLN